MILKRLTSSLLSITMLFSLMVTVARSQGDAFAKKEISDAETQKRQLLESRTLKMLDSLENDIQGFKVLDNRIQGEIALSGILWKLDPNRARAVYSQLTKDLLSMPTQVAANDQNKKDTVSDIYQFRKQTLPMLTSNDPTLALEFFRATRLPSSMLQSWQKSEDSVLELRIASSLASKDPVATLPAAKEALAMGFPTSFTESGLLNFNDVEYELTNTLHNLLLTDISEGKSLTDEIVQKLGSQDLLSYQMYIDICTNILKMIDHPLDRPAPSVGAVSIAEKGSESSRKQTKLLDDDARKLAEMLVNAALRTDFGAASNNNYERYNAFAIFDWLSSNSDLVRKYDASQLDNLNGKMERYKEISGKNHRNTLNQLSQTGTPEELVAAAASVPADLRESFYYEAIGKAERSGNPDLAAQIIIDVYKEPTIRNRHLSSLADNLANTGKPDQAENVVNNYIDDPKLKIEVGDRIRNGKFFNAGQSGKSAELQALIPQLPVAEQINGLIGMAVSLKSAKKNEQAGQLLDRARALIPTKPNDWWQLQQEIYIAREYATIDQSKSVECMKLLINQVNDLSRGTYVIDEFVANHYPAQKDDELLTGGNLRIVRDCGDVMGVLAANDFGTAKALSEQFARPEQRAMAQLRMIEVLMGVPHFLAQ